MLVHAHTNERQGEEGKGGREQGRKNVSPKNVSWKVGKRRIKCTPENPLWQDRSLSVLDNSCGFNKPQS